MSDAVDATVAKIDFQALASKRVYFDSTYLKTVKSQILIDSDYVLSSLRQQMVSHGVLLVESRDEAELIVEARIGALGLDGHNVVYGIPASNALSSASAALTSTPIIPPLPEVSFARKEAKTGAAKLAVFAYEKESREPYWQSGIAKATSNSRDTWVLGVGPFQRGTIYDRTKFAGTDVIGEIVNVDQDEIRSSQQFAEYHSEHFFPNSDSDAEASEQEDEGVSAITVSDKADSVKGDGTDKPSET